MRRFLYPLLSLALTAQTVPAPADPIASLGPRPVRYGDFLAWLEAAAGPEAERIGADPDARARALRQFLDLQVLAAKGSREGLQGLQEFKDAFAAMELQLYARMVLDENRPGGDGQRLRAKAAHPAEAELRAYFQAHLEHFATPERFTVRQILVRLKGGLGARGGGLPEAAARAKLAQVQAALRAGRSFADMARMYSDDYASKADGGLYQDIPFGKFPEAFEQAVRTQPIGQVGEPVETLFGYHLIQVERISPAVPAVYANVKEAVRLRMIPGRMAALKKEFLDRARREVGYRPVGAWARAEWAEQRAESLQEIGREAFQDVEPPGPRWLGIP